MSNLAKKDTQDPVESIENDIKNSVMQLINQKIKENKWTQDVASTQLGISQPRVSLLKNFKYANFTIATLFRLAEQVGIEISIENSSNQSLRLA